MAILRRKHKPIAIRTVEIRQSLQPLTDVREYDTVRIFVSCDGRVLGTVDIVNSGQPISVPRFRQEIAQNLTLKVLQPDRSLSDDFLWNEALVRLDERYPTDKNKDSPAVRHVDISKPLQPLTDVQEHKHLEILIFWQNLFLGSVDIANHCQILSVTRLRDAIVDSLGLKLLETTRDLSDDLVWSKTMLTLAKHYGLYGGGHCTDDESLPVDIPVSVVVATLDRPYDLRKCLRSLVAQASKRPIEIVVVDNNPDSGLTPPVVADFPGVKLVREHRRGLAYARNAGFTTSTGDIAIATDDDVTVPPQWLENLVAPFARSDVMAVTGNVLPLELETTAQQLFESYGGLSRGFERFEVQGDWFESFRFRAVPTWELGATANAAFRSVIFSHPKIGMLDEALGAGMPSGCSEDTYLFYKILKAGYTIVYEPDAYVWHNHRRTMASLKRQLYNYSKGGIAYHLTTLFKDGDLRALVRIFAELPMIYKWRFVEWFNGRSDYPPSLILLEMRGTLAGFWALWKSWQRVKQQGRSNQYIPPSQRSVTNGTAGNNRILEY